MKTVPLSKIAGVSREFNVDGVAYKLSPVTVNVLALIERWAREQPFERLKAKLETLGSVIPESVVEKWCDEATKKSEDAKFLQTEINSIAGAKQILWHCFRANHHDLTEETFENIIDSVGLDILRDFLEKDNSIDGIDNVEPENRDEKKSE